MLMTAFVLFIIAALGGLILVTYILLDKNTPKALAIAHGSIAALALILLLITAYSSGNILWLNVGIFVLVALGGAYVFITDILGKPIPKIVAVIHGLAALIGVILLAVIMFISL